MNQATILALIGITVGVLGLGIIANELRLIGRSIRLRAQAKVENAVALLDLDEFEFEYATRDRDEWDAQAYRMYMEEV
jgi:hypothetical protein